MESGLRSASSRLKAERNEAIDWPPCRQARRYLLPHGGSALELASTQTCQAQLAEHFHLDSDLDGANQSARQKIQVARKQSKAHAN